ncbi:MAG: DUF6531 domain-containing protein [Myxococcota bacterium]|nr:DUF6531 domain-containing protein [Myxococcota bacterium]
MPTRLSLILVAVLAAGPVSAQEVNLRNANLFYAQEDLRVQRPGVTLEIVRTYNSRSNAQGSFGHGWSTNLDIICQEGPDGSILVTDADGFMLRYTLEGEPKERLVERYVDRIVEVKQAQDQNAGSRRQASYYNDMRVNLLENPELRANTGLLLPDAWTDAQPGSYLSFDRGTERMTKKPDGTYVRVRSDGVRYMFDRDGMLRNLVDAGGRGIRLDYDKAGRLSKVSHSQGGTITLKWNSAGLISGLLDTDGREVTYKYNQPGDLVGVVGPGSRQFAYVYDDQHNLTASRVADGSGFQVNYDPQNDWVVAIKQGEEISSYVWNLYSDGHQVEITSKNGETRSHRYFDAEHRHVETLPNGEEVATLLSECCDKPLEVRNDSGVTRYEYDRNARLLGVEHPDGNKVRYAYHPKWSKIIQAMYSDGRRFMYSYNDFGELVEAVARGGRSLRLSYGQNGKVENIQEKGGGSYRFVYDRTGRPTEIRKGNEGSLGIRYGVMGEISGTEIREGDASRSSFYADLREVLQLLEPATGEVQ